MLSKEQFVQYQCSIHVFKVILLNEKDSERGLNFEVLHSSVS